ncbi:MAG: site-specific integrase [Clostridiales bacterium]|nr:site-specific integrase [Clostridiales bacterium]
MGRRGENIRKRSDGRWEARVICGAPVEGKTNYKYLYSQTYQGVRALKKDYLSNLGLLPSLPEQEFYLSLPTPVYQLPEPQKSQGAAYDVIDTQEGGILFRTVAAQWLASKKLSVKESSYASYSFIVEKHLLPEFGDLAIKELDAERIGDFLLAQKSHGSLRDKSALSDKTLSEIKGTLNRVLRYAKNRNLIDAVPDSMPVSVKQAPVVVLTKQEQESIERQALSEDTPYTLGVLLSLYTGIRVGEVCGLQWADFDWGGRNHIHLPNRFPHSE